MTAISTCSFLLQWHESVGVHVPSIHHLWVGVHVVCHVAACADPRFKI